MLLMTSPRSCDRCKKEYPSSGVEQATVACRIIRLCPECNQELRRMAWSYVDSFPSYSS